MNVLPGVAQRQERARLAQRSQWAPARGEQGGILTFRGAASCQAAVPREQCSSAPVPSRSDAQGSPCRHTPAGSRGERGANPRPPCAHSGGEPSRARGAIVLRWERGGAFGSPAPAGVRPVARHPGGGVPRRSPPRGAGPARGRGRPPSLPLRPRPPADWKLARRRGPWQARGQRLWFWLPPGCALPWIPRRGLPHGRREGGPAVPGRGLGGGRSAGARAYSGPREAAVVAFFRPIAEVRLSGAGPIAIEAQTAATEMQEQQPPPSQASALAPREVIVGL